MNRNIGSLAPLSFPLTGSHLIEASAGTGKTFTIAALYVRLVLGHGGARAFLQGRPLTPPEILVVTYTDAATKELRDRIRARLSEAAEYFRADPASIAHKEPDDDLLYDLRADYEAQHWQACARKLQLASEWMDEAAVSTIHGWCNRMLQEHAFDSQSLFTQKLETDQTELFSEVVRDYWRNHFYALSVEDLAQILAFWGQPADLEAVVKPLVSHTELLPLCAAPQEQLRKNHEEKQSKLAELKRPWLKWTLEVKALLDDAKAKKLLNGQKLKSNNYDAWLNNIRLWASDATLEDLSLTDAAWHRLSSEGIAEAWKDDEPPQHPAFAAITSLRQTLAELPSPEQGILCHAAHWIAKTFDAAQKQRAQMGFDDLLSGLEAALFGEHGDRLAEVIRRQFPVALIDEFQDTDPVQYRIFQRVYQIADNRDDCSLILIGDPKQAIYAFRGADIYTYLKARDAVQDRLYTLNTNFRSTRAMVDAANRCFEFSERREDGDGAFLFRQNRHNPVPFLPVKAQGRNDEFVVNGSKMAALTAAVLVDDWTKTAYLAEMAEICATQIVDWLNLGQQQQAGFLDAEGTLKPLQPNDIAILVNNGNEAANIRQALSRRNVRSVYLSDRESVYASTSCTELYRWLAACAEPDNDSLLRSALSTVTLGLSFADLDELNHDEAAWEIRAMQFKRYREIWQRQGVLPMLRNILFDFGCVERLLQLPADDNGINGERMLTDMLHLAELLQQASYTLEGEHALIRYLAEQQASPARDSDAQKLRLESDADLVKVITIHKSKGLEYPIVFLPFLCATRKVKPDDRPLKWHDQQGELKIGLYANDEMLRLADKDRLGEDVRKVYVALTRARYATWLGLAALKENSDSAIGHLLGISDSPASQLLEAVQRFAADEPAIAITADLLSNNDQFIGVAEHTALAEARVPKRPAREHWRITSYSSLRTEDHTALSPSVMAIDDTAQAANLQEALLETPSSFQTAELPSAPIHRFPKGAEAGTFLHELMEWAADQGFETVLMDPAPLKDTISHRCKNRQWDAWIEFLYDWILAMLRTTLPIADTEPSLPAEIRLKDLPNYKAEMEFWFETHQADLERLDAAVTSHTLAGRARPKLAAETINGMLKGFMDLVFEYRGKYYVADYKSNWLGPHHDCYNQANMDQAIRSHRYDLQYCIYLFALHRLLKSRLPDYDYDRHIGGAMYLFMRGIEAETAGVHFERPPKILIEKMDRLFQGHERSAA
ncbi:MAG: exodeoxyribonuclease V subunit beta [Gammaproteobacteria bacterium]